jgi:hypothetical protein
MTLVLDDILGNVSSGSTAEFSSEVISYEDGGPVR